jgi:anti-sigma regulatory factor (Ser/Thr protein kinase)
MTVDAIVELTCTLRADRIEFVIKDEGGHEDDLKKLTEAIKKKPKRAFAQELGRKGSLGLEIVRMLSDELTFEVDPNNLTTVRVVKLREEDGHEDQSSEAE